MVVVMGGDGSFVFGRGMCISDFSKLHLPGTRKAVLQVGPSGRVWVQVPEVDSSVQVRGHCQHLPFCKTAIFPRDESTASLYDTCGFSEFQIWFSFFRNVGSGLLKFLFKLLEVKC